MEAPVPDLAVLRTPLPSFSGRVRLWRRNRSDGNGGTFFYSSFFCAANTVSFHPHPIEGQLSAGREEISLKEK
ncbi:hypothetical protein Cob_v007815 [Colletotrichum orbiculare MAFF 240422]|uniref:Uncharacterized protein n=1 Tax=Colletotrichum orbiculare (strain 104-T / ATCC 96160 / CBS 514.97 / LARS 414 / MAFF 240422) TaxID=1213857 RepID=A0A484FMF9_COLOR|nr:hypothetical protein Cob_v007815 [Colletotrichum orbiculare MAFF 240422]